MSQRDWTAADGRSNSSKRYQHVCRQVEALIRDGAFLLVSGRADQVAGLIVAQLAHRHGLRPAEPWELSEEQRRSILESVAESPDLPPRGVSHGHPPLGLRNWVCWVDGHSDPDNSGLCVHCAEVLDGDGDGLN